MALQIDSINPESVMAEVGTEVVMSCEASGASLGSGVAIAPSTDFSPLTNYGNIVAYWYNSTTIYVAGSNSWQSGHGTRTAPRKYGRVYGHTLVQAYSGAEGANERFGMLSNDDTKIFEVDIHRWSNIIYIRSGLFDSESVSVPSLSTGPSNRVRIDYDVSLDSLTVTVKYPENETTILSKTVNITVNDEYYRFYCEQGEGNYNNPSLFDFSQCTEQQYLGITKTLIDTSDDYVLSSVSPYTYTADIADNGKDFQWEATDGVTTVQSAPIPVVVYNPLQFDVEPDDQTVNEGDTVNLSIEFSEGIPSMDVTGILYFNGDIIYNDVIVSPFEYLIESAELEATGTYQWMIGYGDGGVIYSREIAVVVNEVADADFTPDNILRGSLTGFTLTPIEKCYNDFSIKYGNAKQISIGNVTAESFPAWDESYTDFVQGVDSYSDAKELWEMARKSYTLNSRIRTASADRSTLKYAIDRNEYNNVNTYDSWEEYGWQYAKRFAEWVTRQKLQVYFDVPITTDTVKYELMRKVTFSDPIITPDGETGSGWITSIQCDPKNDVIKLQITFEPNFYIPAPMVIQWGDIIETGDNIDSILETGSETDNIIEGGQ